MEVLLVYQLTKENVLSLTSIPSGNLYSTSIWDSPTVKEFRYLGVVLGKKVDKSLIFKSAFEKLSRTRVNLFLTVQWSFTSRILIANIYLYPLILPPKLLLSFFWVRTILYEAQTSLDSSSLSKTLNTRFYFLINASSLNLQLFTLNHTLLASSS